MDEYIKREATIKEIVDSRNRYYNSASNQYLVGRCEGLDIAAGLLRMAPAADVAPVVRCRDCDHLFGTLCAVCGLLPRKPDDFCSYGARKDGADNA